MKSVVISMHVWYSYSLMYMFMRDWQMLSPENLKLLAQLEEHPQLLERIKKLLLVVEGDGNDEHDIKLADDAEDAVVDNLREVGKELLTEWGQKQEERV